MVAVEGEITRTKHNVAKYGTDEFDGHWLTAEA